MANQTLQRQFRLWTAFLVIVPSLLIMTIYTSSQIKVAKQQNLEMINQRVHSQERLIDYWMAERSENVRELSGSEAFRILDKQQMERTLDLKQEADTNFDSLSYIDKDGYFEMSTLSKKIKYSSTVGRPYFKAALAGEEHISDVVIGRNSGQPIINFSCPIYSYAGEFQGLILGSVRTTTLEKLLHENWIGETGEIFLVNRDGIMLTEPRYVALLIQKGVVETIAKMNFKITDDAFRNIQFGKSGTAVWTDYLGNKVLGAYLDVPDRNWTIIGKINEEEVLAPIYKQLAMMAGGTICMMLLMLPLATLITNRIKLPIEWLIRQSDQVAMENHEMISHDQCLKNIPKELGNLCENFINMSNTIKNTVTLLKENEVKLEAIMNGQRMASLGIMVGSIAHEINQPLNSIKVSASGMLYLMENGNSLRREDLHREFSRIVNEAERIDHVISKTRGIVREGLLYKVSLLLDEVLVRVLHLIKEQELFKDIKIDVTFAQQQAWIEGNKTQIEQVFFHLLTNAAQALKGKDQQEKTIKVSIQVTDTVNVYVADNGPGLAEASLDEIFEPFYTTKGTGENLGLGLAIVKSIIYAHRGEIIAENNGDGGATFSIRFPLLDDLQARKEELL